MKELPALILDRVHLVPRALMDAWDRMSAKRASDRRRDSGRWDGSDFSHLAPSLDDILTDEAPRLLRSTHYVVASLLLGLIVISSLVHVDMIVTASGKLVSSAPTMVVQPMQLAMIRDIKVRTGDHVRQGDVLATLDSTFTHADKRTLVEQKATISAQVARIEAELSNKPLNYDRAQPEQLLQFTLYTQRTMQFATRLKALDDEIQRLETSIQAAERNKRSLADQLAIAREVEDMRARLYKMQVGSKLNSLDSQAVRMRSDREYEDSTSKLDDLTHNLLAKRSERDLFVGDWRSQLLQELVKARGDLSTVNESLVKADRMDDLVVLRAPADGIILEIAKRSVGSVVQAAEQLVTLVPANAPLMAELMIPSADVGYAAPGDLVAIKVDAFPFQRHGLINGALRGIGQDAISGAGQPNAIPASGQPIFHRSEVTLEDTSLKALPPGAALIPGMTVSAEINVGSRTVISYFLYPLWRGISESMREP